MAVIGGYEDERARQGDGPDTGVADRPLRPVSRPPRVWLGVLLASTVALPFGIAGVARPFTPTPLAPTAVGALPTGGTPTDLAADLDVVPLLVENLSDAASRDAVDAYQRVGLLDGEDARSAYLAAWDALAVPAGARDAVDRLGAALLDPQVFEPLPEGAEATLAALATDAANGGRLTNAATMLFGYGALIDSGIASRPAGADYGYSWVVEEHAIQVLDAVARHFGPSRETMLNAALFVSVTQVQGGIANRVEGGIARAAELAGAAVDADPTDITARWMLSNLQARQTDGGGGYEAAVETLRPLRADTESRLLGEAATGDAYLAAASMRALEAPRTGRVLARQAVTSYDRVLAEVADAGVYAGRSRALALLGDDAGSLRAMEEAVRLAPDAVGLRLELGALQQATGDASAMYETGLVALDMTSTGWNPALAGTRYVYTVEPSGVGFAHPGDLGLFGQSVGSTRDRVGVIRTPQGGGFEAGIDVVPAIVDPSLDAWRRGGFAPDVAARLAVDAAVALGDPGAAATAIDIWFAQEITTSQELIDNTYAELETATWAAGLVAGDGMPQAAVNDFLESDVLHAAEAVLRRAGDDEGLEAMCRDLIAWAVDRGQIETDTWRCLGDALMLQDRHEEAAASYADLVNDDVLLPSDVLLRWGAARLEVEPGDEEGRRLLEQAAVQGGAEGATALLRLGIDDLDDGEVAVAVSHFDLALALLDPDEVDINDRAAVSAMRRARAVALTNRGVARLRTAQSDPTRPPTCRAGEAGDPCESAVDDLTAALNVDPLNPVTLMNIAWAKRAMDHPDAARHDLAAAVAADPSMFPAANDLGVIEAGDGDTTAARDAFHAALAAEPDYALGWWNIGILDLRAGPTDFRAGHAELARAVDLDPSLAGAALDYRTDEAVYRATFGDLEEVSGGWPLGRSYGLAAAALGGVGLVAALGRFGGTVVASLGDSLPSLAGRPPRPRRMRALARRFRAPARRAAALPRRLPPRLRPWTPWIVTIAVLAVVSLWTVWAREPATLLAGLVDVAIASAAALAAHEGGHLLALRRWHGRLVPAQWTGGILLALVLLPFQASGGPYLAERVEGTDKAHLARIHVAGPAANLVLAVAAYLAFLVLPVALLLLTSQISVAVAAFTLLPHLPLDGKHLAGHPIAAAVLGALVTGAGVAFATNIA